MYDRYIYIQRILDYPDQLGLNQIWMSKNPDIQITTFLQNIVIFFTR